MIICIDPGHSGSAEPGAVHELYTEAKLALTIACYVKDHLTKFGHKVLMTRQGEIDSDLLEPRVALANSANADLFASIHINAAMNTIASGFEIYHYPASSKGKLLAEFVQRSMLNIIYLPDRGVKSSDFYVLGQTAMPAILIECGFLSNSYDRQFMISPTGQYMLGEAIACGLNYYWRRYGAKKEA